MARALRVAAVQVESRNGEVAANLERAAPFVSQAAQAGAELVLCPEFLAAGYLYDESIWDSGEVRGGATEAWLVARAAEHGIYVGASYLEAEGDDFYNTFALAGPGGDVVGRVRKESLPAFEGWYFRSCGGPKVIDAELGRIAVGICQDNHTARFMRRLCRDDVDLVLMPHSAPCAPGAAAVLREMLAEAPAFYARAFGVPVVLVNKVHSRSRSPIPILPGLGLAFEFPGLSTICDSDGRIVEQLAAAEGAIVGDVHLDPARKRRPDEPTDFYWSRPPSRWRRAGGALFVALERWGKLAYAASRRRRRAARAIAGR